MSGYSKNELTEVARLTEALVPDQATPDPATALGRARETAYEMVNEHRPPDQADLENWETVDPTGAYSGAPAGWEPFTIPVPEDDDNG